MARIQEGFAICRAAPRNRLAIEQNLALVQAREARDAAKQSCLAAAVRPAQRDPFAGADAKTHPAEERGVAARGGEVPSLEHAHGRTLSTRTTTSRAPGFTTMLAPTRSPLRGVASP